MRLSSTRRSSGETMDTSSTSLSSNVVVMRFTRNILAAVLIFMGGANVHRLNSFGDRVALVRQRMYRGNITSNVNNIVDDQSTGTIANNNYQLAFDESYGFFNDISQADWNLRQDWARQQIYHRYGFDPKRHYGNPALWYYNNYNPIFSCPHAKRVWGIGDGPKWICDVERLIGQAQRRKDAGLPGPHCIIYSVGSNGNYEFEDGLVAQIGPDVCEIHIFDFSNDYNRSENKDKNMHFHKWGLQGSGQNRVGRGEFVSFSEILQRLGHENHTIDIFKIDCEGCEWDTYKDWIEHDIRQVLVETHELPKEYDVGFDYFEAFKKNDFAMFSKEVNGFGGGKFYEFAYIKLHPDFMNPPNQTDPAVDATSNQR